MLGTCTLSYDQFLNVASDAGVVVEHAEGDAALVDFVQFNGVVEGTDRQ